MSKFEELCQSYAISQKKYREYEQDCMSFIQKFYNGFIAHAEIPREQIYLVPLHEEPTPGSMYSPLGAMNLEDDTYYHLGVVLTVYTAPKQFPQQSLQIHLQVKKTDGVFLVKITTDDEPVKIALENQQDYIGVYDKIISLIKDHFENGLQKFLEGIPDPIQKIGFTINA